MYDRLIIRHALSHKWINVHVSLLDKSTVVGGRPGGKAYDPLVPVPFQKELRELTPKDRKIVELSIQRREKILSAERDVHWQKSQRGRK